MRRAALLVATVTALGGAACSGKNVPQHSGYKGKKPTPWTKAKAIELDEEGKAKVSGDLDYSTYKRARWYSLNLTGPANVDLDFEYVPNADDLDVAIEVLNPNNKVIWRSDAESDDAGEQKKIHKLQDIDEGTYLIHTYLEGRLDAADFDLKVAVTRSDRPWKSDFPNQVPYPDELAAVPPFDDTPSKPPPPARCGVPGKPKCVKRPPPPPPPPSCGKPGGPPCGLPPISASITNVDPDPAGARITIAAGTNDGVDNGFTGRVAGVKGSSFRLSGCNAARCTAVVKASVDDVRSSGEVVINRQ